MCDKPETKRGKKNNDAQKYKVGSVGQRCKLELTKVGSRPVQPTMAPTMALFPAHSWAEVRCVTASRLVQMNSTPGSSLMQSCAYLKQVGVGNAG